MPFWIAFSTLKIIIRSLLNKTNILILMCCHWESNDMWYHKNLKLKGTHLFLQRMLQSGVSPDFFHVNMKDACTDIAMHDVIYAEINDWYKCECLSLFKCYSVWSKEGLQNKVTKMLKVCICFAMLIIATKQRIWESFW